ncbi:ankyrin repeat-containing domain protein [Mycena floridula]|nr:ankyrin repeat-containing domain protein [Mycena floridula]
MSNHKMSEMCNQNLQPGPVLRDGLISESPKPPIGASAVSKGKPAQKVPENTAAAIVDFSENPAQIGKPTCQPTTIRGEDPHHQREPEKRILGISQFQPSYSGNRTYDYEEKYAPDPMGDQVKPNARVWKVYLDESESYDEDMLRSFRDTIDALLVFAALFSGVVTTLLVQTSQAFQPDYAHITTLLLMEQIQLLRAAGNISAINVVPSSLDGQQAAAGSNTDIWINALFIASLSLSLATALLSVLIKQWLQAYSAVTQGSAMQQALIRQFRITGLENWMVPEIIGVLPLILHASLAAFFAGLALFVMELHQPLLWIVVSVGTATFSMYLGSIVLPALWIQCPYRISVLFVPAQYLVWPRWIIRYLFRYVQYHWRQWREPGPWNRKPNFPSVSAHSLRDAEHEMIKTTGDRSQWDSSTTVHTMGNAISWLHSLKSNTSIVNITTQSLYGIVQDLKTAPYRPYHYIHSALAIPIPSMIDVALDHLFDHSDLQLPTLTDHQKQNEEIYLALVSGFLQSEPGLPKVPGSQRLTASMLHAASHGSLALLKQFVDWGADLNTPDITGFGDPTALSNAAQAGHLETVKFILEQGVDVNVEGGIWGCALADAAYGGKIEMMEYLLNQGANPNAHNDILRWAVSGGIEAVELLIRNGANLQAQGQAALRTASWDGNHDTAKLLIEKGVSPQDEGGNILQTACRRGHLDIMKLLVKNGADVNALGGDYGSILCAAIRGAVIRGTAIQGSESEVIEFLIESGADVNASTTNFGTPLQLAIQGGHKEIEEILRRHGARE